MRYLFLCCVLSSCATSNSDLHYIKNEVAMLSHTINEKRKLGCKSNDGVCIVNYKAIYKQLNDLEIELFVCFKLDNEILMLTKNLSNRVSILRDKYNMFIDMLTSNSIVQKPVNSFTQP